MKRKHTLPFKTEALVLGILIFAFSLSGCGSSKTPETPAGESIEENTASDDTVAADDTVAGSNDSDSAADKNDRPDHLTFTTETIEGDAITDAVMADYKLILVNFWEPWCGPCVNELPDLGELYESYKDKGVLFLGFYTETDKDAQMADAIRELGVNYPIVKRCADTEPFMTGYVPTTYFCDNTGKLLYDVPIIGSQTKEGWESLINEYLAMVK